MIALWSVGYDVCSLFFFFKQKTAYEMRISDWSSDVLFRSKPLQRQFEADGEQQEDDAEMRQRLDRRIVAEEAQRIGTDKHAGDQVPDHRAGDRKSVVQGKSVSVRVDLGGRRIIKNKQHADRGGTRQWSKT